jgi:hypothetical protein
MCSLKRGDVTGNSFSFDYDDVDESDTEDADGNLTVRLLIRSVKLYEVSPVTFPAYESTTASARSGERIPPRIDDRLRNALAKRMRLCTIQVDQDALKLGLPRLVQMPSTGATPCVPLLARLSLKNAPQKAEHAKLPTITTSEPPAITSAKPAASKAKLIRSLRRW